MDNLSFLFNITANDKYRKEWEEILIGQIVMFSQCSIEILRRAPHSELAQAFGNCGSVEFLYGQLQPSGLDTALDEAQLRRIHVLMLLRTAFGLHQIAANLRGCLFWCNYNRVVD